MRGAPKLVAAWLAAPVLVVSGCTSSGMTNKQDSSTGESSAASSSAGTSAKKQAAAKVGSTITLGGNNSQGEKLAVTVERYVPSTVSTDGFTKPAAGKRFAAVQFALRNLGTSPYQDAPANGAKVLDAKGQSVSARWASGGSVSRP
jgi:hypothetical protein